MAAPRSRLGRWLIRLHRWLGTALGVVFVLWFLSGLVMLYHRMPALSETERLERLPALDLEDATVEPAEVLRRFGGEVERLALEMSRGRPLYRAAVSDGTTDGEERFAFADDGTAPPALDAEGALRELAVLAPECAGSATWDRLLARPDQWTLLSRRHLPLHRLECNDRRDRVFYLAAGSGRLVLETDRRSRLWATLGPVTHWLYFTPLRIHTRLWLGVVFWTSLLGCLLTLTGLTVGLWRLSPRRRFWRDGRPAASPYGGLLRLHHYAGLVFGLFAFTWTLSGGLSIDPWNWHSGTDPTATQRAPFRGAPLRAEGIDLEATRTALGTLAADGPVRAMGLRMVLGEPVWTADPALAPTAPRRVAALDPEDPWRPPNDGRLLRAAAAAMPGAEILAATRLDRYDPYYSSREGSLPLPVLRVRYDDASRTALYIDPARGEPVRREQRSSRLDRWLFRGLHSLDLPGLYGWRPGRDALVIVLSLGGLILSASTLLPVWRRLRGMAREASTEIEGPGTGRTTS